MRRRQFLATSGVVASGIIAGCLGDGYPTQQFEGQSVPLVPTDDASEWHEEEDAQFVDARRQNAYRNLRIEGAVHSPAPDGYPNDDPVAGWPADQRIVTYCVCPHALAGSRAGTLIGDGYEEVYALDEGLEDWYESGHPVAGDGVAGGLPEYRIEGRSDPAHAGEDVWVRDLEYDQREVASVDGDGSYEVRFHFADLAEDSPLRLEAPDYAVEAPLATLTGEFVTPSLSAAYSP